MEAPYRSHVAAIRRGIACSLATAVLLGATAAFGDQLTPEVTAPLLEFREKRMAIESKAAADTSKELQALIRKLEKLKKAGTKTPKVSEQAAAILREVEDPEALDMFLLKLLTNLEGGVSGQQAQFINLAYTQRRVTAEDWANLPGKALKATLQGIDTGIDVQPGDFVLVCPHPDQKWRQNANSSWTTFDGKPGNDRQQVLLAKILGNGDPATVRLTREKGVLFQCGTKGRLHLDSDAPRRGNEGSIECKVFKITTR